MDSSGLEVDDLPFQITSGIIRLAERDKHYCTDMVPSGLQTCGSRKKFSRMDEEGTWFCRNNLLEPTQFTRKDIRFANLTYRVDFYRKNGDLLERQKKHVYVETQKVKPSLAMMRTTKDAAVQCTLLE